MLLTCTNYYSKYCLNTEIFKYLEYTATTNVTIYHTVWCMSCHYPPLCGVCHVTVSPTVWCMSCHCIPHCVVYVVSLYPPLCGVCCVTVWCMSCHCIPHCVVYVMSLYTPLYGVGYGIGQYFCDTIFPQICKR